MRGVGTLVAEVAVDLEDALDAADHTALEEQLRCDAQEQIDVEGIGVRDERSRGRPTVQGLQHRGLDLEETPTAQRRTEFGDHRDPGAGDAAGLRAHDEVDVALPDASLLVHVLVRDGQRPQRLRRHLPAVGHHREFAGARADDLARDEHDVPEIHLGLPPRQRFLADAVEADHRLQLRAVALLQRGEAQLAFVAQEDHASAHADVLSGLGTGLEVGVGGADLTEAVGARDGDRVGLATLGQDPLTLLAADAQLLGRLLVGRFGGGGAGRAVTHPTHPIGAGHRLQLTASR